jgi:Metallo-beta-lactamase superfamily
MTAMTVEVLPGGRGDCLWVECHRDGDRPWRLLFDGGMPGSWQALRARIEAVPAPERVIDLAVVSHIDADHIGGIIPLFADAALGVSYGDVWFNGLTHLPDPETVGRGMVQLRSVRQGESLAELLSGRVGAPDVPWNDTFDGGPVTTGYDGSFLRVEREAWPAITLLSPTDTQLGPLRKLWERELEKVLRGEPAGPAALPEEPAPIEDVEGLAATETTSDRSVPNGSSIAFLLEHDGASCLLTGDAYAPVLEAALDSLLQHRGMARMDIDVHKVSHHGSKGNITDALLALAPAGDYVLSTNGDRFNHPDDIGVARIVAKAPSGATVWFNYANPRNARWDDPALRERFDYAVGYPEEGSEGVIIAVPHA